MKIHHTMPKVSPAGEEQLIRDIIIRTQEDKTRLGIKEIEEIVGKESKERRINAPLTQEERILLNV